MLLKDIPGWSKIHFHDFPIYSDRSIKRYEPPSAGEEQYFVVIPMI
jgi:hypothetical protein